MAGLLWCIVGLIALVGGSEVLVRQGTRLAMLAGISPVVIGLTVVAVGTSAPELAVGIEAALLDKGSLAIGNIAGTNTFNILFILGLSAFITPLRLHSRTVLYDLPIMTVAAGVLFLMAMNGVISRMEGMILLAGAAIYTGGVVITAKRESRRVKAEFASGLAEDVAPVKAQGVSGLLASFLWLCLSIAVVVKGADWLVHGASDLARQMGVTDAFIGLTIVAIGTSAPELVTTIISTLRNERDIAIGNLIGSSTYNILAILGITALFPENGIQVERDLIAIDIPVTAAAALVCVPVFLTNHRVTRTEGALFVTAYTVYFAYLVLARG